MESSSSEDEALPMAEGFFDIDRSPTPTEGNIAISPDHVWQDQLAECGCETPPPALEICSSQHQLA